MEWRREAALREEKMRADGLAREELIIAREKSQAEIKAKNKQSKIQANNELQHQKLDAEMKVQIAQMELMERRELKFQQEKLREKDITAKEMEAHLLLERPLAKEKRKTLRLEYEAKFHRHELAESQRLASIPEHISSEQRGPAYTGIPQPYTYSVPTPGPTHSYELLQSLPRVPETPPMIAQPVVTPALGTFPILAPPVLGQLSVVSATHTAPTVPLNLRTIPQARPSVVSPSVVAPGAAVSTTACTAPSHEVPVANIQLPVKPPAGTMPTPIATIPTPTSLVSAVPLVVTSVSAPPAVTTVSVLPVVTTVQATTLSVSTSVAPVVTVTAAPAASIVVVKQPQPTKPYTGQTSWKSYKEYFTRLALCNGWMTGVEKAQNLLIAMERASAETVGGLTADKDEDYDLIWENLAHRFGHIDKPERAKRRFDNKKQLESETIEVFEQGLRTVFREAWPTGDPKSKENDSMLQRRFIDGLFDPALPQFLRLHARTDDFVTTVGKARQYMDAQEQAKVTAISKKPNVRFAAT